MNFQESVDYLLSLGNEVSAMKLGLESIRKMLGELGNPQSKYLKVQVAGTNGKGSVCAFLNSICVSAGIETGMYTSPHLVSITERVKINDTEIGEDDFARLATTVREVSEQLVAAGELENVPTYFEQVTALALLAFAEARVELAILETGLGGRFDATTAADAEICAITRIGYDHQQYLGETLEEIAAEKAAIIHSGSRVVALKQDRAINQVIEGRCREVGVRVEWATEDIVARKYDEVPGYPIRSRTFRTSRRNYPDIVLGLAGHHQQENAAIAIGVAEVLEDLGYKIPDLNVCVGLETASHPGRMEWIGRFLLDGAHNISGAQALKKYLDEFVAGPITMIFGTMEDKDVGAITSILFPTADRLVLTKPDNSRAMSPEKMLEWVQDDIDRERVSLTSDSSAAMAAASSASAENATIVVTGSLYLVGEVRDLLTQTEN